MLLLNVGSMAEFTATEIKSVYALTPFSLFEIAEQAKLFDIQVIENMADNLNVRIGEKYPITVKVEPASRDYEDFTINETSYVRAYNASGGRVVTKGELVIDNTLKTITYIWNTAPNENPSIVNSPQQYTFIIWANISYVNSEGIIMDTLIASDNITKNLIRSSRLE